MEKQDDQEPSESEIICSHVTRRARKADGVCQCPQLKHSYYSGRAIFTSAMQ